MLNTHVGRLRVIGLAEGVSFLVLLMIAMPLKYFAGMPEAVAIGGWIHGVLFIGYCAALSIASLVHQWSMSRSFLFFVAALVPFGPFWVDARLRAETLTEESRQD